MTLNAVRRPAPGAGHATGPGDGALALVCNKAGFQGRGALVKTFKTNENPSVLRCRSWAPCLPTRNPCCVNGSNGRGRDPTGDKAEPALTYCCIAVPGLMDRPRSRRRGGDALCDAVWMDVRCVRHSIPSASAHAYADKRNQAQIIMASSQFYSP